MAANPYTVTIIPGLKQSKWRAIAFLVNADDSSCNAETVFGQLKTNRVRELRTRFDYWIDGNRHDRYFHGWPNSQTHKNCFVFKWRDNRLCHRFYGFLCNPKPTLDPAFRVCVLVSHAKKTKWETDERELDGANALSVNILVTMAIRRLYPDSKDGKRLWAN